MSAMRHRYQLCCFQGASSGRSTRANYFMVVSFNLCFLIFLYFALVVSRCGALFEYGYPAWLESFVVKCEDEEKQGDDAATSGY